MTRSAWASISSALFLAAAPGTVAGYLPWAISGWRVAPPFFGFEAFRWVGSLAIALGVAVLVDAFARFAREGRGTPAPVFPTETLVASGLYRHVRNPMYGAVVLIIAGQALLFGQVGLLVYGAGVWFAFHLFVVWYEEPALCAAFGADYERFRRAVPRWIPRLRPA